MKKIVSLEDKNFKDLRFTLDLYQPVLTGSQSKFVLRDNFGDQWLFKEERENQVRKILAVYEFAKMCGVEFPETHQISLPVNGEISYGIIMRFFPLSVNLMGIFPADLNKESIKNFQRLHAFDWLIYNLDNTEFNFLMDLHSSSITLLDVDHAFRILDKQTPLCDCYSDNNKENSYYCKIYKAVKEGILRIDPYAPFDFINYISSIEDAVLNDIFSDLTKDNSLLLKGALTPLIERKKALFDNFVAFYANLSAESDFKFSPEAINISPFQWGSLVYKKLAKEIKMEAKKYRIKPLIDMQKNQANIDLIYSPEAWKQVWNKIFLEKGDAKKTIEYLQGLLNKEANGYERLALELYVTRLKIFDSVKNSTEKDNTCSFTLVRRFWGRPIVFHPYYYGPVKEEECQLRRLLPFVSRSLERGRDYINETACFPQSISFVLMGKEIAKDNKLDNNRKMDRLFSMPEGWRAYAFDGFLNEAFGSGLLEDSFLKKIMNKANPSERAVTSIYLGRYLFDTGINYKNINSFKKECNNFSGDWDYFCFGLGVEAGNDFIDEPEKFFQLKEGIEKDINRNFYAGFGYGFAVKCGLDEKIFEKKIQELPPHLRLFCYQGLATALFETFNFDLDKVIKFITSRKTQDYNQHFYFRGIGFAIAYWFFYEMERGAELLNNILDKEFKFDAFYGMEDFIYHYRGRWRYYNPKDVGSIVSRVSHMEKH